MHIASYLEFIDIVHLGKSSVRLKSFADLIYRKKTHFLFGPNTLADSTINKSNVETVLQEMGRHIQTIEWHKLEANHLDYILDNCPNVTALTLNDPMHVLKSSAIKKNKPFFKNLQVLHLYRSSVFDGPLQKIASMSDITSLELNECHNIRGHFFSKWRRPKVEVLKIINCRQVGGAEVYSFLQNNNLVKFSFSGQFHHEILSQPPSESLAELQELELNCNTFTEAQMEAVNWGYFNGLSHLALHLEYKNCNQILTTIRQISTLKSLTIGGMYANADTLNCLGLLTNLQKLRLHRFNNGIGGQFFATFHLHLPKLTDLSIEVINYWNWNTKPDEYNSISNMITSLTTLKSFFCNLMTDHLLERICKEQLQIQIGIDANYVHDERKVSAY